MDLVGLGFNWDWSCWIWPDLWVFYLWYWCVNMMLVWVIRSKNFQFTT